MTLTFYRCQHCSKLYEQYQTACNWCGTALEKIILDGHNTIVMRWDGVNETWEIWE